MTPRTYPTPLAPLYVFCSDEILLLQEAVDQLRHTARTHGYVDREVYTVEQHFNWEELLYSVQSPSLFGDKKIIELRIPTGKPGKEGGDAIKALLNHLTSDNVIITTLPKLNKATKSSVWYKALAHTAKKNLYEINSIDIEKLPAWIQARAKNNQHIITPELAEWMASQFEGNLLAAHQEIQKLKLLYPAGPLTEEAIHTSILNVARYEMFKVSEPILAGDVARTCRTIEGLRSEGEAIVPIIWALTNEIRTLLSIKSSLEQGTTMADALSQHTIWYPPRNQLIPKALPKLSLAFLKSCLLKTVELDRLSKGLGNQDPWEAALELSNKIALRISKIR